MQGKMGYSDDSLQRWKEKIFDNLSKWQLAVGKSKPVNHPIDFAQGRATSHHGGTETLRKAKALLGSKMLKSTPNWDDWDRMR
jgi:hypothetical protein